MTDTLVHQEASAGIETRFGVEISGLRKHFKDPHTDAIVAAVDDVELRIPEGQFCVLLGPSGCGKTTLLRCIAGLESPSQGSIVVEGRTVFDGSRVNLEPQQRPIGMVFQNYALWPHMSVAGNVAFPLQAGPRSKRPSKEEIAARVQHVLEVMGIGGLGKRKIGQLSGGQQQRVALARAVAAGNKVVLFDEPLSNIDAKVREQLRRELRSMQRELGFTAVYVTHDQSEAMEMADVVAVMREGRVAQLGTPEEIYFHPKTRYVAQFIGSTNIVPVTAGMKDADAAGSVSTDIGRFRTSRGHGLLGEVEKAVVISKAQHWWIGEAGTRREGSNGWVGTLAAVSFMGTHTEYTVDVNGIAIRVWGNGSFRGSIGDQVAVGVEPEFAEVVIDDSH
jgi:iron(III) transport system ATP-binding protein